tara:strand:- start:243 stop:1085 length:843 start_codon:yes stop_codon:yes gene_type:complete
MVKMKRQRVRLKRKTRDVQASSRKKARLDIKTAIKFLVSVIILGVIGFGLVRVKYMFIDSKYFTVKSIDVELYDWDGALRSALLNESVNEGVVDNNIFFIDLKGLREKIEDLHPEFKNIVVRRMLPNKIIVQTDLRKAVAQIHSDRYYYVDESGVVLPEVKNFPDGELPIIAGIGVNMAKYNRDEFSEFDKDKLNKALGFMAEMARVEGLSQYKLKLVDITDPGNLSFFLNGVNIEMKIGNADFQNRLHVLATILVQIGSDKDKFKYVDLRFDDPIIGPR